MGKVVHRSYASKRKALERIKAKRRERRKEIREPLSRHDKNGKLWFGGGADGHGLCLKLTVDALAWIHLSCLKGYCRRHG